MRRPTAIALLFAVCAAAALPPAAMAAPCRDGRGRFIKCHAVVAPIHCRDTKGRFMKCKR